MNKFFLQGRLGKDPEQKTSAASGKKYTLISVADKLPKAKDGTEKTQWFNIFLFDKQGENALNYLYKGAQVFIEGSITRSEKGDIYTAKEITYLSAPKPKELDAAITAVNAQNRPVEASNSPSATFTVPSVPMDGGFDDIPF